MAPPNNAAVSETDTSAKLPNPEYKFAVSNTDEPHKRRKFAILKAHPEIKELYGASRESGRACGRCAHQRCGRVRGARWEGA